MRVTRFPDGTRIRGGCCRETGNGKRETGNGKRETGNGKTLGMLISVCEASRGFTAPNPFPVSRFPFPATGDPPRSPTVFSGEPYSHQKSRIWESSRRFSKVPNNFTVFAPRFEGGIW